MQSEWGCLADRGTPGTVGLAMFGGPAVGVLTHDGSMVLLYMVTFTINIPPMLAYIPYMEHMGDSFIDSKIMVESVDGGLGRTRTNLSTLCCQVNDPSCGKIGR